jgi:hypothetical protein
MILKIKTFARFALGGLDKEVNEFCSREDINVLEIQSHSTWLFVTTTVIYQEQN